MVDDAPKLDYARPQPTEAGGRDAFPIILFVYPAVPFIGYIFKISVLFVLGGLSTPIALLIAVIGSILNRRTDSFGVWVLSILVNGIAVLFFVPLFVHFFFFLGWQSWLE